MNKWLRKFGKIQKDNVVYRDFRSMNVCDIYECVMYACVYVNVQECVRMCVMLCVCAHESVFVRVCMCPSAGVQVTSGVSVVVFIVNAT